MRQILTKDALRHELLKIRAQGKTLGFVPTMGYLHEGHLSLIRAARKECDAVVVSIFVNPTQFGPEEDFDRYPRDLDRDRCLAEEAGADLLFIPEAGEIYPEGFRTYIELEGLSEELEGASRPGHFRGVATVMAKLFSLVRPDRAYFGLKDAQQAAIIRRMAADLDFDIEIVVLPTVREEDGLALSSRNAYLSAGERSAATVLYRALLHGRHLVESGERDPKAVSRAMAEAISAEPLARLDYVAIREADTFLEPERINTEVLLLVAAWIGETRLIDNVPASPPQGLESSKESAGFARNKVTDGHNTPRA